MVKHTTFDILDTAGAEEYSSMRDQYIRSSTAVLLMFSLTAKSTFDELDSFVTSISKGKDVPIEDVPLIVIGNKYDLTDQRTVTLEEALAYAKKINKTYVETSCKTGMNCGFLLEEITREINALGGKSGEVKLTVLGSGGVGKSAFSIGISRGGGGYLNTELIFYRDKTSAPKKETKKAEKSGGIVSWIFGKEPKYKPHFKKTTSKFKFKLDGTTATTVDFIVLFGACKISGDVAQWECSDEFFKSFVGISIKMTPPKESPYKLATCIALCLFEILLNNKTMLKQLKLDDSKVKEWKNIAIKSYDTLFQILQEECKKESKEKYDVALDELVHNTCVLLQRKYQILVSK